MVLAVVVIVAGIIVFVKSDTKVFMLRNNFAIAIPDAQNEKIIIRNNGGIPLDGEIVTLMDYKKEDIELLKSSLEWKAKDAEINKFMERFFKKTQENPDLSKDSTNNLKNIVDSFDNKCLYFYKSKNNNNLVMVYQYNNNKIYVFEEYF